MKEALYLGKPFENNTIRILENKILKLNQTQYEQEKKALINSLEKIFNKSNNKYILSRPLHEPPPQNGPHPPVARVACYAET